MSRRSRNRPSSPSPPFRPAGRSSWPPGRIDGSRTDGRSPQRERAGRAVRWAHVPDRAGQAVGAGRATSTSGAAVRIRHPEGRPSTPPPSAVGLRLDPEATVQAALAVDAGQRPPWTQPVRLGRASLLHQPRRAPSVFTVDDHRLAAGIAALAAANLVATHRTRPHRHRHGRRRGAGRAGHGHRPRRPGRRAGAAAETGDHADRGRRPAPARSPPGSPTPRPRRSPRRPTPSPRTARTLGRRQERHGRSPKTLRGVAHRPIPGDRLGLGVDRAKVGPTCRRCVADLGTAPVDAGFVVDGDRKAGAVSDRRRRRRHRAAPPDSAQRIATRCSDGQTTVALELDRSSPRRHDRAWAEGSAGRRARSSRSPRRHAAGGASGGQHPPASPTLVRGMIIEPGQRRSRSTSGSGQRTDEKGYVERRRHLRRRARPPTSAAACRSSPPPRSTPPSSAASTSSTTRATAEHIDRYPYGREATISWPKPDLKIQQQHALRRPRSGPATPTPASPCTLYSTKCAGGEQTGQTAPPTATAPRSRPSAPAPVGDGHTRTTRCTPCTPARRRRHHLPVSGPVAWTGVGPDPRHGDRRDRPPGTRRPRRITAPRGDRWPGWTRSSGGELRVRAPHERRRRAHVEHREGPAAAQHDHHRSWCSTGRPTGSGSPDRWTGPAAWSPASANGCSAIRCRSLRPAGRSTPTSTSTTTCGGCGPPATGTMREVFDIAQPIAMQGFDRARPLWEFTVVEGLEDGRAALIAQDPPLDHRRGRRHEAPDGDASTSSATRPSPEAAAARARPARRSPSASAGSTP